MPTHQCEKDKSAHVFNLWIQSHFFLIKQKQIWKDDFLLRKTPYLNFHEIWLKTGGNANKFEKLEKIDKKEEESAKEKEEDKMDEVDKRGLRTGTMIKIGKMRCLFMCVLYIPDPLVNMFEANFTTKK